MCMLTVFPMPDLLDTPTTDRLINGAESNPHGHGWAVVTGSRIAVGKSMNAYEAIDGFKQDYARATGPAMFHSRWATHGAKDEDNTHPFPVRKLRDTYVAHNGIMPVDSLPDKDDPRSDTRVFADDILPIKYRRLDSPKVRAALEMWLRGNKIAILTTNSKFRRNLYLFGRTAGEWVDGVWYSNNDYEGWYKAYAGEDNYSGNECEWCHQPTVNKMLDVCETCGTCQDCFEPQATCQCYFNDMSTLAITGTVARENEPEIVG